VILIMIVINVVHTVKSLLTEIAPSDADWLNEIARQSRALDCDDDAASISDALNHVFDDVDDNDDDVHVSHARTTPKRRSDDDDDDDDDYDDDDDDDDDADDDDDDADDDEGTCSTTHDDSSHSRRQQQLARAIEQERVYAQLLGGVRKRTRDTAVDDDKSDASPNKENMKSVVDLTNASPQAPVQTSSVAHVKKRLVLTVNDDDASES
jgi:hypothetical protein